MAKVGTMRLRDYVLSLVFIHLIVSATIIFNIPILRQLSLFIYLLLVPGFVFLGLLKIEKIGLLDLILYSVGLSIALVMFIGLFVNEIYPIFGISHPLSTVPIFLTTSLFTLVISVVGCRRGFYKVLDPFSFVNVSQNLMLKALLLMLLPVFSFVSAVFLKETMPLLPVLVVILFVVSVLSAKLVPVRLYPLLVFAVSLSLALQFPLMTKHIVGNDSPLEFYVYKLTALNQYWLPISGSSWPQSAYNSMLSITILPTMYSTLLSVDGELVFKVLFPTIFSFVPVVLYRILAKENWKIGALVSALFFISSPTIFYGVDPLSLNRQIVAELFLLLSIFLLLEKHFSNRNNRLVYIIFCAGLAVSHYSLMILYLIFLFFLFAFERFRGRSDRVLNGGVFLSVFAIAFSWYSLTPSEVTNQLSNVAKNLVSRFSSDLTNPDARSSDIFAPHTVQTAASAINWTLFIAVHFFIVVGILAVYFNRQEVRLDSKYRILIIFGSILLFLAVAVPNLAPTINFGRFYAITFLFLAPCFVFGGRILLLQFKKVLIRIFKRHSLRTEPVKVSMLMIGVVLSAYFLSQYGFVNYVTGASPLSYTLDWNRIRTSPDLTIKMGLYNGFTPEQDISSATWLSKFMSNNSLIYSDFFSLYHPLKIYGLVPESNLMILTNVTTMGPSTYVYLRYFNIIDGYVTPTPDWIFSTSRLYPILNENNCVYTNGASNVYASLS